MIGMLAIRNNARGKSAKQPVKRKYIFIHVLGMDTNKQANKQTKTHKIIGINEVKLIIPSRLKVLHCIHYLYPGRAMTDI